MNETKLTPQLLALCYGGEVEIEDFFNKTPYRARIDAALILSISSYRSIKPILRRLESITEEEYCDLLALGKTGIGFVNYKSFLTFAEIEHKFSFTPKQFAYLLSKGFDLGLLPEGTFILK